MKEQIRHFRLMTFNTQLLFDPTRYLGLDFNDGSVIEARARVVRDRLLEIPEPDIHDVLCLNEVLYGAAEKILREGLGTRYPYSYWVADADGEYVALFGVAGGAVGFMAGGPIGAVAGAIFGALLGGSASDYGVNPGVMILSRTPFEVFDKIDFDGLAHIEAEHEGVPFSAAFFEYGNSVGDDAWAEKGFLMTRVRHPFMGSFHVIATHMQADYKDACRVAAGTVDRCTEHLFPPDRLKPRPVHTDEADCQAHPEIRAQQIDRIVGAIDAMPPPVPPGPVHTLVTGDLNFRGEPDATGMVVRDGQWVTEYASLVQMPAEAGRRNFNENFVDEWIAHARPPAGALPGRDLTDHGITNIDTGHMIGQRLDYIIARRNPDDIHAFKGRPEIVPHLMVKRFRSVSDHESVEAAFSYVTEHCSPATAGIVADHFPAPGSVGAAGNVHAVIQRDTAYVDLSGSIASMPDIGGRESKGFLPLDRYEWFLLDVRSHGTCIDDAKRRLTCPIDGPDPATLGDGVAYCDMHGRASGTYAVLCQAIREDGDEVRYLDVDIVYCNDLSRPATPERTRKLGGVPGMDATMRDALGKERDRKLPEDPEIGIYGVSRPVYLRTFVPAGFRVLYVVTRFMGTTCESALQLKAWEQERTPWPQVAGPGQVPPGAGPESHQRWYRLECPAVAGVGGYPCRIVVHNPHRRKIAWDLLTGECGNVGNHVEKDMPLTGVADDALLAIDWTGSGAGESLFLRLDWLSADIDMRDVDVAYRTQVSWFCHTAAMALTAQCVKETSGLGSDEVDIRFRVDGNPDPVHHFYWDDADTGERIPSSDCPAFGTLWEHPIAFTDTLKVEIQEDDGPLGGNRGHTTILALTDDVYSREVDQAFDLTGSGRYRITGTLCRNREGQYS